MRRYIAYGLGLALVLILALIPVAYDVFPFLPVRWINDYTLHILIIGFFYAILASSWALLMGYGGQFSFAHMAFAGIGAYTTGLLARYLATNAVVGIFAGTLMAGLFGLLIGMLVLRLRKTYLALFTIAFAEIVRLILSAEKDYTEGPNGLPVPPLFPEGLTFAGVEFSKVSVIPPYYIMFALMLITLALMSWMAASRFGLFLKAIREDEEAAAALGVDVVRYKILVFVVTSMIAGLAGATRAHYVTVIAPNDMIILWMSIVITMAVLGGIENLVASAIGGIVVIYILEELRTNIPLATIVSAILALILTVVIFQLARYLAKRFAGRLPKGAINVLVGFLALTLSVWLATLVGRPVTTLISYTYYDLAGSLPPQTVDMSAWRLVFFGIVLMLTLQIGRAHV